MQVLDSEASDFVQSSLQSMQNDPIGYFDFPIGLWMPDQGQLVRDMKFCTELSEVLVVELSPIVGDDSVWQSEFGDDGLLDKVFHLTLDDLHQGFGLHPLSEVVDRDDYELSLTGCRRKRSEYVNPPPDERAMGRRRE